MRPARLLCCLAPPPFVPPCAALCRLLCCLLLPSAALCCYVNRESRGRLICPFGLTAPYACVCTQALAINNLKKEECLRKDATILPSAARVWAMGVHVKSDVGVPIDMSPVESLYW